MPDQRSLPAAMLACALKSGARLHELRPWDFFELGFGIMHVIDILQSKIMEAGVQLMFEIRWRHTMTPSDDIGWLDDSGLKKGLLDVAEELLLRRGGLLSNGMKPPLVAMTSSSRCTRPSSMSVASACPMVRSLC